jgi:L-ribulokinase
VAIIDAHAGVVGAGVGGPGELVLVLGTSGCHLVMAEEEHRIPGVAGVVADGILPGWYGYETGQAAMGDAFDWVRRVTGLAHADLEAAARALPAGSDGVTALDWFNGCRTPLMDGALTGAVVGLGLEHGPAHLYRAVLEASACGLRWIVETLRAGGVPIERLVATGGLPHQNPLFVEIVAAVLGEPVEIHRAAHGPAVGAAVLGALAADRFPDAPAAVAAMARPEATDPVSPGLDRDAYRDVFVRYRALAERMTRPLADWSAARPPPTQEA